MTSQTAHDFACIASLGTGGCGFEQQLEAAAQGAVALGRSAAGRRRQESHQLPHRRARRRHVRPRRQREPGFLRNDPTEGLSLIAIILITDEDDCSSANTHHFTPPTYLDPNDPLAAQPMNLRCYYNELNGENSPN